MHSVGLTHSSIGYGAANISGENIQHYDLHHIELAESITFPFQDLTPSNNTVAFPRKQLKSLVGISQNGYFFIIGSAIGASALIILVLFSVLLWRYYKMRLSRRHKTYCLNVEKLERGCKKVFKCCSSSSAQSESIVCLSVKPSTHLGDTHLLVASVGNFSFNDNLQFRGMRGIKERPLSDPVPKLCLTPPISTAPDHVHHTDCDAQTSMPASAVQLTVLPSSECVSYNGVYCSMPNIELARSASSSTFTTLDQCCNQRPLSAGDDMNNLFGSFNRKRKNRMHNDIAAAIALSKSRSSLLEKPNGQSDTESLVDSDTEVVYNERTSV